MAILLSRIDNLILDQLHIGEKRLLGLVVSVRKVLNRSEGMKGNLTEQVQSALRKMVASERIVDADGMYSLKISK